MVNAVAAIGYQLEKVHAGVLTILLDSRRGYLGPAQRAGILNGLGVVAPEASEVECIAEYSFGRRTKIDLVMRVTSTATEHHLIFDLKTDSVVHDDQLKRIKAEVDAAGLVNPHFFLVLQREL